MLTVTGKMVDFQLLLERKTKLIRNTATFFLSCQAVKICTPKMACVSGILTKFQFLLWKTFMIGKIIRITERVGKIRSQGRFTSICAWPLKNPTALIFRGAWFGVTSLILYLQQDFPWKLLVLQAMKTLATYMKMWDPASVVLSLMQMDYSLGLNMYMEN